MNKVLLKALGDLQRVHAGMRSIALNELANEVLDSVDDSSTPTSRVGKPDRRLYSMGYDYGMVDYDGPLELLDDPAPVDPYNTI